MASRSRLIDENTAKIERVAVLKEARGRGVGIELMRYLFQDIHSQSNIEYLKETIEQGIFNRCLFEIVLGKPYTIP